jgi:hypothetical protein
VKWITAARIQDAPASALPPATTTCQNGRCARSVGQSAEARLVPKMTRNGAEAATSSAATISFQWWAS